MKKLLFALMAVVSIMFTSCKHNTCTLYVTNEYDKAGMVLFSTDENCSSVEAADFVAKVAPGKAAMMRNVNLNGLYAIFYVSTGVSVDDYEAFSRKGTLDLSQYVGMGTVTCKITDKGYYGVEVSNF